MNTISLRLYPETETLYKRLLDECDSGTNGKPATADQFINYLMECAQNPRKIEVSQKQDTDRITELEHKLFSAESELTIMRDAKPASVSENQIIFEVNNQELQLINDYRESLLRREVIFGNDIILYLLINGKRIKR